MEVYWGECFVDYLQSFLITDKELLCFCRQAQKGTFKEN